MGVLLAATAAAAVVVVVTSSVRDRDPFVILVLPSILPRSRVFYPASRTSGRAILPSTMILAFTDYRDSRVVRLSMRLHHRVE